jgi:predicted DNA-binding antitoxin AbrB/MazE fold protein
MVGRALQRGLPWAIHFGMTYRGIYRDGVIVPETSLRLPEGAEVDITVRAKRKARKGTKRPGSKRRTSADKKIDLFMMGFGILKNDPSVKGKSTAAVARELRKRAVGDRFGRR